MRQQKESSVIFKRVESVEVVKLENRKRIRELCPDGYVYDLTMEDNHNFLANGILSHNCSAFPKPSKRTKLLKEIVGNKYLILMTGTFTPESYSQVFHQFWISNFTPFVESNFYKWAKNYVQVRQRQFAHGRVNDYSHADIKKIDHIISPYVLTFTQEEAKFSSNISEHIHTVKIDPRIHRLINKLEKDLVLENKKGDVILADTPVKLRQKIHQLCSGTIIIEGGEIRVLDVSKCDYINKNFSKEKKAIFYKFKAEKKAILDNIDNTTTDLDEFNNSDKNIALQIVSGREGISLKNADCIIMYNIDDSNVSYIQSKDRMTTIDREENNVHWLFSDYGMEKEIYKVVTQKKAKFNNYFFKIWQQNRKYKKELLTGQNQKGGIQLNLLKQI